MSDEGDAVAPLDTAATPFPGVAWVASRSVGVVGQLSLLTTSGTLNKAFIPMLQNISPGELQSAQNALDFAHTLVKEWHTHSSSGKPVTDEEKKARADEIAGQLRSHQRWLSHSKSIKMDDLRAMRLKVTDYTGEGELGDAVQRYYTLLQMTFSSNIYKVIETPVSQIYRFLASAAAPMMQPGTPQAQTAVVQVRCARCGHQAEVQASLEVARPLEQGKIPFPADNRYTCPSCGEVTDLSPVRRQIEAQTKRRIV